MAYNPGGSSDPISINGLFLKHYLDIMGPMGMVKCFETKDISQFNLYVMHLRASVMGKQRRAAIDEAKERLLETIEQEERDGLESSKTLKDWRLGFCVVEACTEFLNDAFHITQSDGAALIDMTDDELMMELQRYQLMIKIQTACKGDKERRKAIMAKVSSMEITTDTELKELLEKEPEEIPQSGVTENGTDQVMEIP